VIELHTNLNAIQALKMIQIHNRPWEYNQVEREVASAGIVKGVKGSMFDPLPKITKAH